MHLIFIIFLFFLCLINTKYNPFYIQSQLSYIKNSIRLQNQPSNNNVNAGVCSTPEISNSTVIQLGNCQNQLYYLHVSLGSNQQQLNFQFDTGSNVMWIPLIGNNITQGFNSSQSTTFNLTSQNYSISYADGSGVSGYLGYESFTITNTSFNNMTFQLMFADQVSDGANQPPTVLGLVGFGYSNIPNPLDVAYQNNLISTPVFALDLNNIGDNKSYLYYNNGLPQQILDQTYWINVYQGDYWQVQVIGVLIGDIDFTSIAANAAVIDSGTSLFYVNQELYNAINQQWFSSSLCSQYQGMNVCPCNQSSSWPSFTFMFIGVQVFIPSSAYIQQYNSSYCIAAFGSLGDVPQILLGDTFFNNYIISFDKINSLIGFQGLTAPIYLYGSGYFLLGQYILTGLMVMLSIVGLFTCIKANNIYKKKIIIQDLGRQLI